MEGSHPRPVCCGLSVAEIDLARTKGAEGLGTLQQGLLVMVE